MENLLHLKAPGDWINDPNGFIYYQGEYHLFYQYFPCAAHWGTMHWGHAVSKDLIHWKHLGIALYPSKEYDKNGVFSGSAIEKEGKLLLYYTAVQYIGSDPENIHHADGTGCLQSQVLLVSDDGRTFDNLDQKRQVILPFIDSDIADAHDCRDPKVWKEGVHWYMTLGSTNRKTHQGVLLVMESDDGLDWRLHSRVEDRSLGHTLECPDLFAVDGKQVLISSPMGNMSESGYPENQATIRSASFQSDAKALTLDANIKFFDYGMELYAPQSTLDAQGQRTVIAWLRMPKAVAPEYNSAAGGRQWNGMMSLPRVVNVRNGCVYTPVHPEVRAYFQTQGRQELTGNGCMEMICGEEHCILAHLEEGESLDLYGVQLELLYGQVKIDRSNVIPKDAGVHTVSYTPPVGGSCEVEIYLEPNIVEVYINDGQYVVTNWIAADMKK